MKAALLEPEIVTHKGKPVSVILPIKDYEELLERVGDAEGSAALKRAGGSGVDMDDFVKRVHGSEVGIQRDWVGNDTSARNQHGVVYLNESPLRLRLSWRASREDPSKFLGIFDLDLRKLLAAGHVRLEKESRDAIRLRFYHGMDDVVYIQVNRNRPALPVGTLA